MYVHVPLWGVHWKGCAGGVWKKLKKVSEKYLRKNGAGGCTKNFQSVEGVSENISP